MPVEISERKAQALLIYDRRLGKTETLTRKDPLPLICVGNRYLIEHQLEWFNDHGFKNVRLSLDDRPKVVEAFVRTGSRWGARIDYTMDPEGADLCERMRKHQIHAGDGLLLQDGGAVLSFPIPPVLEESTAFYHQGALLPILYFAKTDFHEALDACENETVETFFQWAVSRLPKIHKIEVEAFYHVIDGVGSFLRMNKDIMDHPGTFYFKGSQTREGVRLGRMARVASSAELRPPVLIGDGVVIQSGAVIGPGAFIGDRAYIDRHARVGKCVVGPGTYVGRYTTFQNQYVCRNYLVDLESGANIFIDDPLILGDLYRPLPWTVFFSRFSGFALFIVSIAPVLLLMPIHRLLRGTWLYSEKILNQPVRRNMKGEPDYQWGKWRRFDFGFFLFDVLPSFFDIMKGHLNFVGNPPLREIDVERINHYWKGDVLRGKAGCTGPVQQLDWKTVTSDEVFATTIYYNATRSIKRDLAFFFKALIPGVHRYRRKPNGPSYP